jgi:16S rRNA (guanine527-N7)-methyltransferase
VEQNEINDELGDAGEDAVVGGEPIDEAPREPDSPSLAVAIAKAGLELPTEVVAQLDEYCRLLWDWNEKINLTRHTTFDLFVRRDLLDSWQLSKVIEPGEDILDIGSGGGVPGLLLAILRPDVQVSVCDSVGKKAKVLDDIVERMKLSVPVHAMRVQAVLEDYRYSSLVARAVGPLEKLCEWLKEDWHNFDRLLALKGPKWIEERGAARHRGLLKGIELRRLVSYPMPGTESESVILQLRRLRPGEKTASTD